MANQVERDVRQRDVFFENRAMAAPLRHTMTEYETVVAQPQHVLEQRIVDARGTRPRRIERRVSHVRIPRQKMRTPRGAT